MTLVRPLLLALLLLTGAAGVRAADEAQDGEWISYRDAYRQMIRFEKYGKPKHLVQHHLQVVPKDKGVSLEGARLTLTGPSLQLNLPLDAAGRAVFPFLKSAYDDNARIVLNRKVGQYLLQPRISLAPRADGTYELGDLRAACEQALDYLRHTGRPGVQDKACSGVRFSYPKDASPVVRLRGGSQPLAVEEAAAFADAAAPLFKTVSYRFGVAEKGTLVTEGAPVAIAPEFR